MGVRASLNNHPLISAGVVAAFLLGAAVALAMMLGRASSDSNALPGARGLAWFSTDDGATWFADSVDKFAPFKKDGKDAYRVYVWRGPDGKEFVSHLERYTAQAHRDLEAYAALPAEQRALEDPSSVAGGLDGIEVKKPRDKTWYRASDPRGQQAMRAVSPSGKTDGLSAVEPR